MTRSFLAAVAAVLVVGCGSSTPSSPSSTNITFTAQLSPANETPAVTNAESSASGTATIVFVPTKDAAGNIASAVGTATVTMQGFPAGSTVTLAHIHTGAAGTPGGVFIGFVPGSSVPATNGSASFTQTANVTGDQLTSLMNNPAGYYFNVHTQLNPGGAMRGQLVRQ